VTIEAEIAQFLRAQATSRHVDEAHRMNVVHPMVVYGEVHVGDNQKSPFFAELVRRAAGGAPTIMCWAGSGDPGCSQGEGLLALPT
jgi:hypothetical protein